MKKQILSAFLAAMLIGTMAGCSNNTPQTSSSQPTSSSEAEVAVEIPTLSIGYMFSNHQAPLIIAAAKGDALGNIHLREINEKENYVLVKDGKDIANINLVACSNGGEVMTMMVQNQLQLALSSIGLPITNNSQGANIKVISPIHADGIGLIGSNNLTDVNDFDSFINYAKAQATPVKIGYHSPANAPVVLFEEALTQLGVTWTEDPEDTTADILMINLKGTANLIPSLTSGEVDGWVGPSPWPELATLQNAGKLIVDLKDLPPVGRWTSFPCCVFSATQSALDANRSEVEAFYTLLSAASNYANTEKEDSGIIVGEWMGVDVEAAKNTMTVFTTDANENWLSHCELVYDVMQQHGQITGEFEGKSMDEIKDRVFDLTIANK